MISVKEAKTILSTNIPKSPTQKVSLETSVGFILAADIHSPIEVPLFDNSAMDGYALSIENPKGSWEVTHTIQAGETNLPEIAGNKAARIFTGAPVPKGTDTVIQQEVINRDGDRITFDLEGFTKGQNIRLKGSQNKVGDLLVQSASLITPGTIGLLASVGIAEVEIYKAPSVAIIITGNEIKDVGTELKFGEIYNSNGPVLKAYLSILGIKEIKTYKAADEPEALQATIEEALAGYDVVLFSGGISVGDYDFVKSGLEKAGVKELFYKIRQRPGKPLFAGMKERKLIFALPGNPASVMTCFNQYVKPSLLQMLGHSNAWQPTARLTLSHDFSKKGGLTFFMKALMKDNEVSTLTGQESFNQLSFGISNCFAEFPEDTEEVAAGTVVDVYTW
ncbi:MAG TPA: molybdopterin molybdotransferase MoeA [Anditalea sp.]|nr:molybdopterin molybdotransferase MoeA [Anditalea sp.]